MPSAIHQVMGVFAERDAVGGHTLALRDALRARDVRSEVFAAEAASDTGSAARPLEELDAHVEPGRTVLVYQASTFAPVADLMARRAEPLVVNFHNVTPALFFWPCEPSVAEELLAARQQLRRLATYAVLAVSDSRYNDSDLERLGYQQRAVVPVLIDTGRLGERGASPWPARSGARWLFVGRLAPNKAQHDVVKAFAFYRRVFDPGATLALPGLSSSHRYETALAAFINALGLDDVVLRPGSVPDQELGCYYREADVFVCLSDHEGFCNTVVEAMAFDLPVLAFASSALPETVAGAGLLVESKAPAVVATAVHRVITDPAVKRALIAAGRMRQSELALASAGERLCDLLTGLVGR